MSLPASAVTKGATVRSTLAYLDARLGPGAAAASLARLGEAGAALAAVGATQELPYIALVALWEECERACSEAAASRGGEPGAADWADDSGAFSINSTGVQMYGGILRKSTPQAFLTQSVSLFRLYYQPGDMEVVEDDTERAVLRLVGFDPVTSIFCRRQSGGLRRAIELAGGSGARARHTRCALDGDAFCEWELRWTLA